MQKCLKWNVVETKLALTLSVITLFIFSPFKMATYLLYVGLKAKI